MFEAYLLVWLTGFLVVGFLVGLLRDPRSLEEPQTWRITATAVLWPITVPITIMFGAGCIVRAMFRAS